VEALYTDAWTVTHQRKCGHDHKPSEAEPGHVILIKAWQSYHQTLRIEGPLSEVSGSCSKFGWDSGSLPESYGG